MIFVDQTKLHDPEKGVTDNCLAACVATVLEVPLDEVPEFENMGNEQFGELVTFASQLGRRLTYHPGKVPPMGYSIGTVTSPRFPTERHAVVCLDGKVVHDPHPSRASMNPERIWYYETFEKVAPFVTLQALSTAGLNPFAVTLLAESLLQHHAPRPVSFKFSINRKDCPDWAGVRFSLEPLPAAGKENT